MNKYLEGILGTFLLFSTLYGIINMFIYTIQSPIWGMFMLFGITLMGALFHDMLGIRVSKGDSA